MSDGFLSQEEIDALLRGEITTTPAETKPDEAETAGVSAASSGSDSSASSSSATMQSVSSGNDEALSEVEKDALGELGNISMGSAATTLSILLGKRVSITTPRTTITTLREIKQNYPMPYVIIEVGYTQGLIGTNLLAIKESDALIMADLMMGGDGLNTPTSLNELYMSAMTEAMNQMMGSVATSMATIFKKKVDIAPPAVNLRDLNINPTISDKILEDVEIAKISFRIEVEGLIDSELMQIVSIDVAKEMVANMLASMSVAPEPLPQMAAPTMQMPPQHNQQMPPQHSAFSPPPPMDFPEMMPPQMGMPQPQYPQYGGEQQQYAQPPMYPQQQMMSPQMGMPQQPGFGYYPPQQMMPPPQQMGMPQQQAYAGGMGGSGMQQQNSVQAQPVQFSQFQTNAVNMSETNINLLLDVPLHITVELGRTRKLIREILELAPGSVVELDKLAGEPVDILVNGKLVAKGEVVVIDENFGVRVTDIVSRLDRFNNLQ